MLAVPLQEENGQVPQLDGRGLPCGPDGPDGDDDREDDAVAEIRIEQKKRSMAWLWLLLLLIIAAAVAWYVTTSNSVPSAYVAPAGDSVLAPSAAPVPPTKVDSVALPTTSIGNRMRLVNA